MRTFVINRSDGGVSITRMDDSSKRTIEETIQVLQESPYWKSNKWTVMSFKEVPNDAIPEDRYFRNALEYSLNVNMGKARGIHMDHIRKARDRELKRLDVEYMRADERGDTLGKQEISALKQRLRDIPQKFDLTVAKTPGELKALWPVDYIKRA